MSTSGSGPPVVFLHGFWPGSWCSAEVLARVTGAGARAPAVDMAGHGLRASPGGPDPPVRRPGRNTYRGYAFSPIRPRPSRR